MSKSPRISGLLYPHMKVERAGMHLQALQEQLRLFAANPYTITEHDDVERGQYIISVALNKAPRSIPVLTGDYAYALRSALDNLAWQLGLLSGRAPSNSSAFPIHSSESTKDRERFLRVTWSIPCEAVEIIKALQPYVRGKDFKSDPLWQLNKLCNLDKHQIVGYSCTELTMTPMLLDGVPNPAVTIHDDTGVTDFVMPLAHKGKVKLKIEPPGQIFGRPIEVPGPAFQLSEVQVAEIYRYIREDVLPRFARFFPMGSSLWPSMIDGKPV